MNLLAEIKREHSKEMCRRVVTYVGNSPVRFTELMEVFMGGPYRVTQRASWPLSCCIEEHPELIGPHLPRLLSCLKKPDLQVAVRRNIVRLMQYIDVPKRLQGTVAALCFGFLLDSKEPIAVRCFSMTVLANVANSQPELRKELRIILEDMYPYPSAGMASRARNILKKI